MKDKYRLVNTYKNAILLIEKNMSFKEYQEYVSKSFLNDYMQTRKVWKFFLTCDWVEICWLIDKRTDLMLERNVIEEVIDFMKKNGPDVIKQIPHKPLLQINPMLKATGLNLICQHIYN